MGFYIRKSVSVGPFRFNLSKSGIGISTGIKGLRFGVGPRGNYVHIGRGGLYYRATLPPSSPHAEQPNQLKPPFNPDIYSSTFAPLEDIESADVSQIVDTSSQDLLNELNQKLSKIRLWPIAAMASVFLLGMAIYLSWPPWLLIPLILVGIVITFAAHAHDDLATTVVLLYEFDSEMEIAYRQLHDAAIQIAKCASVWHIEASGKVLDRKYHAGASNLYRRNITRIHEGEPPNIKSNINAVSIGVGRQTLHFLPDRVLIYEKNRVGAIGYKELRIDVNSSQFIEDGPLPRDAEIISKTWRYVNKSGGPDRRFNNNIELPICRYEEIKLSSNSGLNELLQLSRSGIGGAFSDAISLLGKTVPAERAQKSAKDKKVPR
jgi:hypothetical protein